MLRRVVVLLALIQHGENQPRSDDPELTPQGWAQAETVAELFSHAVVDAIYASPLRRAQQTAGVISVSCGLPTVTEPALAERMDWTAASGLSLDEFLIEWRKASVDRAYVPPVGESSQAAANRLLHWVRGLPDQYRQCVVAVTHGGVTVDLLRTLLGDAVLTSQAPGLIESGVPSAAITEIAIGADGAVEVLGIASTKHLDARPRSSRV